MAPTLRRLLSLAGAGLTVAAVASGCGSGTSSTGDAAQGAVEAAGTDSEDDSVTFTDVAAAVGLDFRHSAFRWSVAADPNAMMGAGLCWLDADADGWLDLFVVDTWSKGEWSRWNDLGQLPRTRLYRNDHGQFHDVTDQTGAGVEVRGNGCVAADLDGDGFTDIYVTTERQNVLLWNVGGTGFEIDDGTSGANSYGWHSGAAVGDVNGDGWLDIFVVGYADMNRRIPEATKGFPNTFTAEPDLLLLSQGAANDDRPRFVDVAAEVGIEPTQIDYGLGAVLSDIDRDGDLDLYVANDTHPNRLYLNRPVAGNELGFRFEDNGAVSGVADDNAGMGVALGDYDRDGLPDIAVTNMAAQGHNVFESQGGTPPHFESAVTALGLDEIGQIHTGWGAAWADFDLDGDLDLILAHGAIPVTDLTADRQPVQFFQQVFSKSPSRRFQEVATSVEGGDGNYLARGLAAADYDNDGDVDVAVGTIGGDLGLLRNESEGLRWLTVAADPATPGTAITVTATEGEVQRREIVAGSSYLSSEDPRAHFGLGLTDKPVTVEVVWPDGTRVVREGVEPGQILHVRA